MVGGGDSRFGVGIFEFILFFFCVCRERRVDEKYFLRNIYCVLYVGFVVRLLLFYFIDELAEV